VTDFDHVKDSGERRSFGTGSVRDVRTGKGRYDLIPPKAVKRIAQHFENGAVKYGDKNWELGQPLSSYLDSGLRHTFNLLDLQVDEDHAAAGIWNLIAFLCTADWIIEGRLPRDLDDIGYCDALEEAREDKALDDLDDDEGWEPSGVDLLEADMVKPLGPEWVDMGYLTEDQFAPFNLTDLTPFQDSVNRTLDDLARSVEWSYRAQPISQETIDLLWGKPIDGTLDTGDVPPVAEMVVDVPGDPDVQTTVLSREGAPESAPLAGIDFGAPPAHVATVATFEVHGDGSTVDRRPEPLRSLIDYVYEVRQKLAAVSDWCRPRALAITLDRFDDLEARATREVDIPTSNISNTFYGFEVHVVPDDDPILHGADYAIVPADEAREAVQRSLDRDQGGRTIHDAADDLVRRTH
jgi:hypothetical protein